MQGSTDADVKARIGKVVHEFLQLKSINGIQKKILLKSKSDLSTPMSNQYYCMTPQHGGQRWLPSR